MSETQDNQSDQIVWPTTPPLAESPILQTGRPVVELLCQNGQVLNWTTTGPYARANVPYTYEINSMTIQFLPHWPFYSVGGTQLNRPTSQEDLDKDIAAVKHLQSRGQLPPNSL